MNANERNALLSAWIKPSSVDEQARQERAERMVKEAIAQHGAFDDDRAQISVYTKGSYPNNTNVRSDSDVDVVVENGSLQYYKYASYVAPQAGPLPPYQGIWTPDLWRKEVLSALCKTFGGDVDETGKIAIYVPVVPGSRPSIDVVPSFLFRMYTDTDRNACQVGSRVFDTAGSPVDNWPKQQLENGRSKNTATGGRYKYYVRALKNAENTLCARGLITDLPSYLMECLVYNVPDENLKAGDLDAGFRSTLVYLFNNTRTDDLCAKFIEPNGCKYLFEAGKKWTRQDAHGLLSAAWDLLDYS